MRRSSTTASALLVAAATCSYFLVMTRALPQHPRPAAPTCLPHEMEALLAFKQGVTSDPGGALASWTRRRGGGLHAKPDSCCHCTGVRCSNRTGRVIGVRLASADLNGGCALVGQISPSLLSLDHLEFLDLSGNHLEGSTGHVPEFLGSLKNLKYLNLSGIPFSGRVPPHLGNLSKLQYLDISGVQQGALFSLDMSSWLPRLQFLEYLNLQMVNLSRVADWPHLLNMIPTLKFIDLSDCMLASANQPLPYLNRTSHLEWLDLSGNYFHHQIASCWFWNLTSLRYLNMALTGTFGQLPEASGSMLSLEFIDLSYNKISMPVTSLKNLCSLRVIYLEFCFSSGSVRELIERLPHGCSPNKLQELHLQSNELTGDLPNSVEDFTSLVVLDLSWNNITGVLPTTFGKLTSLRMLDLSYNSFSGGVPCEIGALTNLTDLDLRYSGLDGVITELKSLQHLYLSYTSLKVEVSSEWQPPFRLLSADFATCQLGPRFPSWLRWMVDIYFLDISSTGINDRIPHWFSNTFANCLYLSLAKNQLTGDLPRNLVIMSVQRFYLNSNNLTGRIPPLPQTLTLFDMSMNSLSGPLPLSFVAPNLTELSLFSNRITGRIPEYICRFKELMILDLANNLFEGKIPPCFGMTKLMTLELSNNSLSGEFPSFLQNSTNLQFLDLAWNNFSGGLPVWIGNLVGLQFLRLRHNMFSGTIPLSFTNLGCLQYLDIAENGISGSLPRHMSNLTAMRGKYSTRRYPTSPLFCSYYDIPEEYQSVSLSTVIKGQDLNYGSSRHVLYIKLMSIDLSLNNLSGEIPGEISTLDGLLNLNLSHNHFSRNIPCEIGQMKLLESLDLSRNSLSGEIPASVSDMAFLSYLDLSNNNLTGRIPSGAQLDTLYALNPYMYTGNMGLCGPPLITICSNGDTPLQSTLRGTEAGSDFFYLGLGYGFIVGIWMVFSALLFKERWRIACFHLIDKWHSK